MAFDGSGLFSRVHNWVQDKAAALLINASRMDEEFDGIATALSKALLKDGQQVAAANQPMGGYKHTGVAVAAARTDYAQAADVQDGRLNYVVAGGTADALTATVAPAIVAYASGQIFWLRLTARNATATPTLAVSGLAAKTIKKRGATTAVALVADDLYTGNIAGFAYNATADHMELVSPGVTGTMAAQAASAVAITGGTVIGITDVAVADGGTGASTAAGAVANLGIAVNTQTITSSTTWTKPAYGNVARIQCWGGGGGGGQNATATDGGGGGGGGYTERWVAVASLGATETVTIGAGGAGGGGGFSGAVGGDTTFGSWLTAYGGGGGAGGAGANAGGGGGGSLAVGQSVTSGTGGVGGKIGGGAGGADGAIGGNPTTDWAGAGGGGSGAFAGGAAYYGGGGGGGGGVSPGAGGASKLGGAGGAGGNAGGTAGTQPGGGGGGANTGASGDGGAGKCVVTVW